MKRPEGELHTNLRQICGKELPSPGTICYYLNAIRGSCKLLRSFTVLYDGESIIFFIRTY